LSGQTLRGVADVLEDARVERRFPGMLLHDASPSIEDGLAARSIATGEISPTGLGSVPANGGWRGESQRTQGGGSAKKSADGALWRR
ncbi:MAG: hypothetical protein IRY87_38550, partial [Acetobacteraceae bacterium]|nr:hypothetical protein [Acetobacteraceae bacterium]